MESKVCSEDYVLREFVVRKENEEGRKVYQFQYVAWSDHGVPDNIQNTLNFIEHVNKIHDEINAKKPIVCHCSAGIGRTGAVIVIDVIIDRLKHHGLQCDIDVYKTVCHLRSQRSGMIQTEKQYEFLYLAIERYIENVNQSRMNAASSSDSHRSKNASADFVFTSTPRTTSLNSINQ